MADLPEVSVAARLAAELEQGAEFVDHGSFVIDAERALDQLAHYQLGGEGSYVLRFAEAALLAGVTYLRFVLKPGSLCASFVYGSEPFVIPGPALEHLTSVLVNPSPLPADWPARALLVNLAIGVVAVLRRKPTYLAIESVGRDGRGWRMVYASQAGLEPVVDAAPGIRIYLREAVALFGRLEMSHPLERKLLCEHSRFARTWIDVDGVLNSQKRPFAGALVDIPIVDGRGVTIGAAGLVNDARSGAWPRARLLVLSHGLLIESIDLSDGQRGFLAVVDVPLPRDLSQTVVTRSHEFDAMLASVYAAHAWIASRHVYTPRQPQPPQPSLLQRFIAAVNAMINP